MQIRKALLAVAVAMAAAACGVANPFAPANAAAKSSSEQQQLRWAQCMRQHGIDVSDPSTGSAGVRIQDTGGEQQVQAAMAACQKYRPNGGQSSGPPNQRLLDAATKFAQCMRDHGIPMQDPQVQGNTVRMQGNSQGEVDPNSSQFQQAQQACQHFMQQAKGGS